MIRPSTGLIALSIPVATIQTAPISAAEKPCPSSARVASTISVPNSRAGRVVTQSPRRNSLFRNAPRIARAGWRSGGGGSNQKTSAISTTQTPATVENAARTPIALAPAPITGPSSAPNTAAPIAVPIVRPRRSLGVASASQESAPAHVIEEPMPWTNRAPKRRPKLSASATPTLASVTSVSPPITATRAPKRDATIPPGTAASRTPIAKPAARTPTPAFERSNSRRK